MKKSLKDAVLSVESKYRPRIFSAIFENPVSSFDWGHIIPLLQKSRGCGKTTIAQFCEAIGVANQGIEEHHHLPVEITQTKAICRFCKKSIKPLRWVCNE